MDNKYIKRCLPNCKSEKHKFKKYLNIYNPSNWQKLKRLIDLVTGKENESLSILLIFLHSWENEYSQMCLVR